MRMFRPSIWLFFLATSIPAAAASSLCLWLLGFRLAPAPELVFLGADWLHWPLLFLFLALAGHAVFWTYAARWWVDGVRGAVPMAVCGSLLAGPLGLAYAGFWLWYLSRTDPGEVIHRAVWGGCLRARR